MTRAWKSECVCYNGSSLKYMKLSKMLRKSVLLFSICLLVVAGFVVPSSRQNLSANTISSIRHSYNIQFEANLDSQQLITELSQNGFQPKQLFSNSSSAQLKNYFNIQTSSTPTEVKQALGDGLVNLEIEKEFSINLIETALIPNDPGVTTNPANIDKQWGLLKANFDKAWDVTTGSRDVVVAIIDTGVDTTHEDLRGARFQIGYDVINQRSIPTRSDSDENGHGTLVAGVIGATADNELGISGAAWQVTMLPVKALSNRGTGTSSNIAEAIVWATDNGADVINLSLGGTGFSHDTVLSDAITYAFDRNVVIVAAAGNDAAITGGNLDNSPVFPICNDNGKNMIIGVTATDVNDLKPTFANYGKNCIDVTAPGRRILSTINHDPATGRYEANAYAYASGTSLAVPYVSAQAVLLKALYPTATNRQIRDRIISTAQSIDNSNLSQCGGTSCRGLIGMGRIDVSKSLSEPFPVIVDGDIVKVDGSNDWYLINGSKKQFISPFVKEQRYTKVVPKTITADELSRYPESSYAEPLEGTLVKVFDDSAIYYISNGLKLPVTYQVFLLRNLDFANVYTLSSTEVNSWLSGSFLTPPEGTLMRTGNNPTVYWVSGGVLHAINNNYFIQRGLSIFPVIYVDDLDIASFPKGNPYIL